MNKHKQNKNNKKITINTLQDQKLITYGIQFLLL